MINHKKIQYLLNEIEVLETITKSNEKHEEPNVMQHWWDAEAYQSWLKNDRYACFTMLTSMYKEMINEFEHFISTQGIWSRIACGGTFATRLHEMTFKFEKLHARSKACHGWV